MKSIINSTVARKADTFHKATGTCVFVVTLGPDGTRFPTKEDPVRPNERAEYLDHCLVCGKPYAEPKT